MLVPLSNHVILKKKEADHATQSGIILTSKEPAGNEGIVESAGPEVKSELLKDGVHVIFKEYKAEKVHYNGADYFVIEDKDIIAVVE